MTDQLEYESVRLLRLQPGDVVVVRVDAHIDRQQAQEARDQLLPKFPGHEVLVLGAGADLEIIRDGDEPLDPTGFPLRAGRQYGDLRYDQTADYVTEDD